jgi:hypothetical protein
MGEGFIVRKGGAVTEQALAPTITEVSKTDTTITFTVTNNDAETATVYYDFDDEVTSLSEDNVTLATTAESDEIEVTGLTAETQYTIYSVASAFNKMFSPQTSLAITTEETPAVYLELLNDSGSITTAVTTYTINNLNISKEDNLVLVVDKITSNAMLKIGINNNNTATNYYTQIVEAYGSTIGLGRVNDNIIARSINSGATISKLKLTENGYLTWQSQLNFRYIAGLTEIMDFYGVSTFTSTSITRIDLTSAVTNGIGVGSRIQLYKVRD